jgi:NADH dehydrogenase FAD-containing subunit
VATAGLEQESIAYPVRALARHWKGARFRLGEVRSVDFAGKRLLLGDGELSYDYLVLAAGSRTTFSIFRVSSSTPLILKSSPRQRRCATISCSFLNGRRASLTRFSAGPC